MLLNAFSLNMLPVDFDGTIAVSPASLDDARAAAVNSAVGHADTASVFASVLGVPVACNRATVKLNRGDSVIVGQYSGPRLDAGATVLPAGATINWVRVIIN